MKQWIAAARPATLTAAFVPVAVGSACAHAFGALDLSAAAAALLGAFAIQIGTNFANDLFDAEKGADDATRLGPTRAVAAGLITPAAMRVATIAAFALAAVPGAYLASQQGWPVIVIGLASIASGIAYTGGPLPLAYNGLGDVFVMIFFGFVAVCGTAYVQAGEVPWLAWPASVPVGAIATAILVVNNLRDRTSDARTGKRTLAVAFGRRVAIAEYTALIALAYAVPIALFASGLGPWVLLPLSTLPWAALLVRDVFRREGRALNRTLVATALLLLVYGLSFAAGIGLAGSGV